MNSGRSTTFTVDFGEDAIRRKAWSICVFAQPDTTMIYTAGRLTSVMTSRGVEYVYVRIVRAHVHVHVYTYKRSSTYI